MTMILGGLWHGAAWSYAVWGLIHGVALAIERLFRDINNRLINKILESFVYTFFVQIIVTLAWLTFKLPEFKHVLFYFDSLINNFGIFDNYKEIGIISFYLLPVVGYHLLSYLKEEYLFNISKSFKVLFYGILIFLLLVNSGVSGQFIYFQF